jgi:NADPH:quinone reductase-like Zn-dependent oxidoreductase
MVRTSNAVLSWRERADCPDLDPKRVDPLEPLFSKMIESGEFRPVIDRTYPLDQIVEAYRYVETGQKTGNVVISLESSH